MAIKDILRKQNVANRNPKARVDRKKIAGLVMEAAAIIAFGGLLSCPISDKIEENKFRQDYENARIEYAKEMRETGNKGMINGKEVYFSGYEARYSDGKEVSSLDLANWVKEYQPNK